MRLLGFDPRFRLYPGWMMWSYMQLEIFKTILAYFVNGYDKVIIRMNSMVKAKGCPRFLSPYPWLKPNGFI